MQDSLLPLLEHAGCPLTEHIAFRDTPPCNCSALNNRLISFDAMFNAAYLHLDDRYDPYLSEYIQSRTRILFGERLNDFGKFSSYGLVAAAVFVFSDKVHTHIVDTLKASRAIPNALRISIHLRHKDSASLEDPSADEDFDSNALEVLKEVRHQQHHSECIVFAASDRNVTLDRISREGDRIGCKVFMTEKRVENEVLAFNERTVILDENGPWAMGRVQAADILLLSHGDYFIGTSESTFSVLIADYIAWRRTALGQRGYPFYWLDGISMQNGSFGYLYPQEPSSDTYNCHLFMNQLTPTSHLLPLKITDCIVSTR